jgi:predicted branched-subunit amino acid permease
MSNSMGHEEPEAARTAVQARDVLAVAASSWVFGISFGVVAATSGLGTVHVVLMSALVNAGASQFGAVSTFVHGGGVLAAVGAGILLNLRYLAISIGAAPGFSGGRLSRVLRVQMANDASYTLGATVGTPEIPDGRTIVLAGAAMYLAWVSGTAIGALLGPVLGDPRTIGADVALPAGFAALLVPMLRERAAVRAAVAGTVVALVLSPFVPLGVAVAAAAASGALAQWSR